MCLAIPGRIVELVPDQAHLGTVEVTGVRRKVDLGLLQDDMPVVGDWVLIHVGFAMTKISEQDAMEQMHLLRMLGETEQAMEEVRGYGLEGSGESCKCAGSWSGLSMPMLSSGEVDEVPHAICRRISRPRTDYQSFRRDSSPRGYRKALSHHGSLRRSHACHLPLRPKRRSAIEY